MPICLISGSTAKTFPVCYSGSGRAFAARSFLLLLRKRTSSGARPTLETPLSAQLSDPRPGVPGEAGGKPTRYESGKIGQELFDLKSDPGETTDVAADYPEEVARLLRYAEIARADLGDKLTGVQGANIRPHGKALEPSGQP